MQSRKNEERKFLRGRFLAGVTDLRAHDEATMTGIVVQRKQALVKQSIKKQHDSKRHYLDNIRIIEHEIREHKLKTSKELEDLKRYGMANIEAAQALRTQAEATLVQFDKAVQQAAFSASRQGADSYSDLSATDPAQRNSLEAKCKQYEQDLESEKAKYNAGVEKKEQAIQISKKTLLRRLEQAHAEHDQYETKLQQEEQSEMVAIMQRISDHDFDLCGRFLELDQLGNAALQKQSLELKNKIAEHKQSTQLALVDIHDAAIRLQVAEQYESGLTLLQQALKEVNELIETPKKIQCEHHKCFNLSEGMKYCQKTRTKIIPATTMQSRRRQG